MIFLFLTGFDLNGSDQTFNCIMLNFLITISTVAHFTAGIVPLINVCNHDRHSEDHYKIGDHLPVSNGDRSLNRTDGRTIMCG